MKPVRLFSTACVLAFFEFASWAVAGGISTTSPFLPQSGSAPVAQTENSPLELRGIMDSADGYLFGLFDPAKRKAAWVKLNEEGHDFTVRAHDVQNSTVTVEYQGRTMTLAMKAARIETVAHVEPPPVAKPQEGPPSQAQVQGSPEEEQRRLERVAAEVRRRRAQRQAAAQKQHQQPPRNTSR